MAAGLAMAATRDTNKYLTDAAPWKMKKEGEEGMRAEVRRREEEGGGRRRTYGR